MNLQKLRLGQLKPADGTTTVGDVHFPKVRLLLPLDGSNGATATSDSSNDNRTITFVSSATIATAQSKFGGSSLYIPDGSSRITTPGTSSMNAAGDFTMEVWIYNSSSNDYPTLLENGADSNSLAIYLANTASSQVLRMWNNGSATNFSSTLPQNEWYHFALVRSGSTVKLYVNGTADSTTRSDSNSYAFGSATLHIGGHPSLTSYGFQGYLDDFRLTIGLARYTSNFTPPTSAHSTQAGDINKHIVVNSDADGVAIGTGGISQARIAKAWCNFDGTGTPAIRASYNCSSITDIGTGKYKVHFSEGMSDEGNYVAFCAGAEVNSGSSQNHLFHLKRDSSVSNILNEDYVYVASANTAATQADDGLFCVLVFGN